jgi:aryl-alcohol dehydrogenase-like predicted oxidoreductase
MKTAQIPNTDLQAARICFGTANLGATVDEAESLRLLDAYLDAGGNFIDTALVYSDWVPGERSRSEKLLGRWMAQRHNRSRIVLATKGAHPHLSRMQTPRMRAADIAHDIAASLQHLQTDVIDLYWLHRDDIHTPVENIIDTLNTHVRAGHIRYFGCSNWRTPRIRAAQQYAATSGQHGFTANQMLWSAAKIDPRGMAAVDQTMASMDDTLYTMHRETQMAAVPYSSQAGGLFTKLAMARRPSLIQMLQPKPLHVTARNFARTVRNTLQGRVPVYPRAANAARLAAMQRMAQQHGYTLTQVVLGYLLAQPFPTFPIVGCRSMAQLQDSLGAADASLSAAEIQMIDTA